MHTLREALADVIRSGKARQWNLTGAAGTSTTQIDFMSRVDPTFRSHSRNPALAETAAELLGADAVRLVADQVIVKEPARSGTIRWHQDSSYWHFEPPDLVTCWMTLDPVTSDSGGIQYVPGSHRFGRFGAVDLATGVTGPAEQLPPVPTDPAADGHPVVAPTMAAGDFTMHHALTWHASARNVGTVMRRAVILRYMADGTRFNPRRGWRTESARPGLVPGQPVRDDYLFPIVWTRNP